MAPCPSRVRSRVACWRGVGRGLPAGPGAESNQGSRGVQRAKPETILVRRRRGPSAQSNRGYGRGCASCHARVRGGVPVRRATRVRDWSVRADDSHVAHQRPMLIRTVRCDVARITLFILLWRCRCPNETRKLRVAQLVSAHSLSTLLFDHPR